MPSNPHESRISFPDPATVKRLTLAGIASEPLLASRLVLKGGSALELLYGICIRSSIDLDFSIEGDFAEAEFEEVKASLQRGLERAFSQIQCRVFDILFESKPPEISPDLASFWGGYGVRFKLIPHEAAEMIGDQIDSLRRNSLTVGPAQRRTFEIDISRHELCRERESHTLDGVTIFAYSPRLIVAEKLRAICQQVPEYRARVRSRGARPRARDFFDIHNLIDRFSLVLATREFLQLIESVFEAKRVPVPLLWSIDGTREFHRVDFSSVLDTVPPGIMVLTFDEYFDGVLSLVRRLESLWHK